MSQVSLIIATDSFGKGLNFADIRQIVVVGGGKSASDEKSQSSMQGQFSLSDLTQWWGRAGRDGKPAIVHWFVDENYVKNSYISYELKFILHLALTGRNCIRPLLLRYFRFNDEQLVHDSNSETFESLCCSVCIENKSLDGGCAQFHSLLKAATTNSVLDINSVVEDNVCRHPGCSLGPGRLPRVPVDEDEAAPVGGEEDEPVAQIEYTPARRERFRAFLCSWMSEIIEEYHSGCAIQLLVNRELLDRAADMGPRLLNSPDAVGATLLKEGFLLNQSDCDRLTFSIRNFDFEEETVVTAPERTVPDREHARFTSEVNQLTEMLAKRSADEMSYVDNLIESESKGGEGDVRDDDDDD